MAFSRGSSFRALLLTALLLVWAFADAATLTADDKQPRNGAGPAGARGVFRGEGPSRHREPLPRLPRERKEQRRSAARLARRGPQGGRKWAGRGPGQARLKPADRSDPLRGRRANAPQGQTQGRRDRRADRVGEARSASGPRPARWSRPAPRRASSSAAIRPRSHARSEHHGRPTVILVISAVAKPSTTPGQGPRMGAVRRSTVSFSPGSKKPASRRHPRPKRRSLIRRAYFDLDGTAPLTRRGCRVSRRRFPGRVRAGSRPACWHPLITASGGGVTGSTSRATARTRPTRSSRGFIPMDTAIATGSCGP